MSQKTIDQINSLRMQGYNESQIITSLQEQDIPPREINDSFAQAKIKEAVEVENSPYPNQNQDFNSMQPSMATQDYQAPIPGQEMSQDNYQQSYPDQQQYPQYGDQQYEQQPYQEQYQPQEYQQYYQGQPQEQYYGTNTETMAEVADQLIKEKLTLTNNAIASLAEFKILIEGKVEKIDERLQRIEKIIDHVQASIIRTSSNTGQDIEDVKTEMKLMQESFGKVINPLTDAARAKMPKHSPSHHTKHKTSSSKKKKKI